MKCERQDTSGEFIELIVVDDVTYLILIRYQSTSEVVPRRAEIYEFLVD
jgi:hypothetical protein